MPEGLYSLTPTQRLKRGNKAANKRREIYSLFCEFLMVSKIRKHLQIFSLKVGYMTPLSAPRIWLFLWWDVHNNFNPSSTEFDKSKNQEEISIISNILIVILYSTKEYLEGPKTAAYVNNKIKLSYRIINEGISELWLACLWLSGFWLDETLALLSLRTGGGERIPGE